jgi:energy-coupling factor transport system ATP-binding protein
MFIGTEKLTHTYMPGTPFTSEALKSVSFSLEKGQVALIIGPSGSGKTTLIQHLNGLLKPSSGTVIFDGLPIETGSKGLLELRRRIGLVFQMPEEQFFSETVFEEVAFAPRNLGLGDAEVALKVTRALNRVGLKADEYINRHPFHLSAGQKRLVAIAAILSSEPDLLILDEPIAGLDPAGQQNLLTLMTRLNREEHLTIVISTHHLEEIAAFADKVLVLSGGEQIYYGSTDEVLTKKEELNKLGLALPEVTKIIHELYLKGLPLDTACYSLADARAEINKLKEF